jgi:hypothetical protein
MEAFILSSLTLNNAEWHFEGVFSTLNLAVDAGHKLLDAYHAESVTGDTQGKFKVEQQTIDQPETKKLIGFSDSDLFAFVDEPVEV